MFALKTISSCTCPLRARKSRKGFPRKLATSHPAMPKMAVSIHQRVVPSAAPISDHMDVRRTFPSEAIGILAMKDEA
jgi:hypothetical protein